MKPPQGVLALALSYPVILAVVVLLVPVVLLVKRLAVVDALRALGRFASGSAVGASAQTSATTTDARVRVAKPMPIAQSRNASATAQKRHYATLRVRAPIVRLSRTKRSQDGPRKFGNSIAELEQRFSGFRMS